MIIDDYIQTVLFDIDGVLTDGFMYVDNEGETNKRFSYEDLDAFTRLKNAGYKVGFISGEKDEFTEFVKQKFKPDIFVEGSKDKLADFKTIKTVCPQTTFYVGDSKKDSGLLAYVRYGFVPKDAALCWPNVLDVPGGQGVIANVAEVVLDERRSIGAGAGLLKAVLKELDIIEIVSAAKAITHNLRQGRRLLICGNGGSAAQAQHMAAELVGRYKQERKPIEAIALTTDTSIITSLANDYSFDKVFARQVEALGRHGDVLIAISTSGKSKNILQAVEAAKERLMLVVGLSGQTPIEGAGYNIKVSFPGADTPRIQEAHLFVIHQLCEYLETRLGGCE
jgi:D-sedoheptulose 7-phosphate isomerase